MNPMLLNAKKRFMLWIVSLVLFLGSAIFSYAEAADVAERSLLGFSPDGAYFAFEEYGVQDGSGFPYSNIYIIRTSSNSWLKDTPIRILVEDENGLVDDAREKAEAKALPHLEKYKIGVPGLLLAHNPVTEIGHDATVVKVAPGSASFLTAHALTFQVETMPIATKRCQDYGDEAQMGYRLTLVRENKPPQELHVDKRIPTSRGCPKRYRISDIIRYEPDEKSQKVLYVVIMQVFSYGFEGDDGRYLATSYWLPKYNAIN